MKRFIAKSLHYTKLLYVVLSLGLLLATAGPLWAEAGSTSKETDTYEEEITVTATRTGQNESTAPGTTEVVTKDEAAAANSQTVADAVTAQGISCPSNGGASSVASVQLDGASPSQTMVMLNGIPLNEGTTGQVDLNFFPMTGVEKIEIAHGPLSALYGANALGGVVNIITDLTGAPGQTVTLGGGSFQNQLIGLELRNNQWGLAAGANRSAGYRSHSDTVSGYFIGQYDLWEQGDEYLRLHGLFLSRDADTPGATDPSLGSPGHQTDRHLMLDLSGRRKRFGGDWEYKLFGQSVQNGFIDQYSDSNHQASRYGADLAGSYELGDHQLLGGLQYHWDDFESNISGSNRQTGAGLFVQDIWTLNGDWILTTGLRQDYQTDFESPLTPRINLTHVVTPNFSLKLGYGESFRAPTINERYWNQPEYGMAGNPNLRPELGKRYDLSGEWRDAAGRLAVDYFCAALRDGITWMYSGAGAYTPVNIDQININGLNLTWERTWNDWLTGKLRYAWLDKEGRDPATGSFSRDLNVFGRNQLNLGLGMKWGAALSATFNWRFVGGRSDQTMYDGSFNKILVTMPDYNTLDLNLQYQPSSHWSVAFQAVNLTNQSYEVNLGYPMPGRAFTLIAGYAF